MDHALDLKLLNVKPLTAENVNEIVYLQQKSNFSDGWTEKMLVDGFIKGGLKAFGVYFNGTNLVAFVTYSFCDVDVEIQDILVDKEFRKKGIATYILNELYKILKDFEVKNIFLEVREGNKSAKHLYIKNGFTLINTRKKYYSNGENALILQKIL